LDEVNSKALKFEYKNEYLGPRLVYNSQLHHLEFKCKQLLLAWFDTANVPWPPPANVSTELKNLYDFHGAIEIRNEYRQERQNGGAGYNWTKSVIDQYIQTKSVCGGYGLPYCDVTFERYAESVIKGKHGFVFGSQSPWAEGALLRHGAAHVSTVEYMKIHSDEPRFTPYHPKQIAEKFFNSTTLHLHKHHMHASAFEIADFAFSYSSFEHDGLGRYGDPISPFADLESIARVHCLLKPGGIFFLGIPLGRDTVVWNLHRIYGPLRLHLVLSNWELVDVIGFIKDFHGNLYQPMLVLKKK
jgi:hypothetical protein